MITKQQRIKLRSLATNIKPTVWVGKDGFDLAVYQQIEQELFNHELIKIALNPSMDKLDNDSLAELATKTDADVVTQIGKKIVLYKLSNKKGLKHVLD
ncbi:MAG: YhbY family RNA-binding protein [Clostridia bacterium]|nr:YhbY family RNA-binding protein [Clostridia bacterium]